jgi:hypothetical protein
VRAGAAATGRAFELAGPTGEGVQPASAGVEAESQHHSREMIR